jgi:GAF domain-containing protein
MIPRARSRETSGAGALSANGLLDGLAAKLLWRNRVRRGHGHVGRIACIHARSRQRTILGVSQTVAHVDADALARSLADLNHPEPGGAGVQAGIERVVLGAAGVFSGSGVGLMLIADDGHTLRYVASSDDVARRLELAHEQAGEGPCVDAFVGDTAVKTDDLAAESRWPELRAALGDQPVRALLGLPTRLGAPVGTLNVYCERPRAWDESEVAALEAYNNVLEARLAEAVLTQRHDRVVGQLQFALDSRVVIERAIGLLMGRDGIDGVAAFNELRRVARSSRRRVSAVAEDVLAEHPQEPGGA